MTVQDFVHALRVRWKFICVVIVLAILGALAYVLLAPPKYQASTRLFVATPSDGTNTQTNDGGLFAQRRVLSYTQLIEGGILAQRTIDKLGLDMTAGELVAQINAEAPTETVLIDVTVTDESPERARDIANTLSDEFVVMAAELETPDLGARPNAQVIVQERAALSDTPVAPRKGRTLMIAAVLGVILGVLAAVLRDRLADLVRRPDVAEEVAGVGVIGEIPDRKGHGRDPLVAFGGRDSVLTDAFRELRVAVQNLEVADGPRVLLVTGPTSGEGRTTTTVNLALALGEAGASAVVVDGDLRRPRVAACFGLATELGLSSVLEGAATLAEALQETDFRDVSVLPGGSKPADPTALLGAPAAAATLGQLGAQFDYVLVDSPPLSVKDGTILAASVDGALIVVRQGQTRRKRLTQAVTALRRAGAPLVGVVMTMTSGE